MTYEPQQPIATSTPRATSTESPDISTEPYHQILPGMSAQLYPTLVADCSLDTHVPDKQNTLQMQLTSEVDKYLQEAAERREKDVNYFDGWHVATNTISHHQNVDSVEPEAYKIPELIDLDTGEQAEINIEHYIRYGDKLEMIPEENEEDLPVTVLGDNEEVDAIPYAPGDSEDEQFNTAIDDNSEDPMIIMGKPLTTAFISPNIRVPTEKVGCLQVTNQLKEFLNHFPPESKEKAFEQIYEILQVLDAYLRDNPQQHIYCMSPDSEYVSLIMYTTQIGIDLCNFLAIWAVLSILLDTQSNTLQHVKGLQQVMKDYYDKCPMEDMQRLEHQIVDIMNAMYDSVNNDNFDSVSGEHDRVSGVVDNDYDRYDKEKDKMPYDKEKDKMPYDKEKEEMPYDKEKDEMPYDKEKDEMPYDKEKDEMPYDKEKDEMPYDKEKDEMPYDKEKDEMSHENDNDNRLYDTDYDTMPDNSDNDKMPDKYTDDNKIALERVKYDRNMTNDELKDIGTKDVVIH